VAFRREYVVPLSDGRQLALGERTLVVGILNVTPDSFAEIGARLDPARAVDDALRLQEDGADIVEIGGESTRPGAEPVPAADEWARIGPVLEHLRGQIRVPVAVDTYKAEVAGRALAAGATIVNDVSGLRYDPTLAEVVARAGAALVLMHTRGRSRDMYREAHYDAVVPEVARELRESVDRAVAAGVSADRLIVDPGLGFAKRPAHSYEVLAELPGIAALGRPVLVGPSRKAFLCAAIGERTPGDRDRATAAVVTAAILAGAHLVRVHAVREMMDAVRVADELRRHA
jgi:dihydropteroate synthase